MRFTAAYNRDAWMGMFSIATDEHRTNILTITIVGGVGILAVDANYALRITPSMASSGTVRADQFLVTVGV
tara:strand:- start:126 stop:338 length:213 start_codon:yes stop_codon:yes gene_type:complete